MDYISLFLVTAVQMGTPLLFGTLGAIMCEKVGHLNLGVEGMMLMGAVMGFSVGLATSNPALVMLSAAFCGALGALIYAIITITFRGNHTVTGLVLTIFGAGVSNFFGTALVGQGLSEELSASFAAIKIPLLSDIPVIGQAFFAQNIYVYLSVVCAIVLWIYMNKTKFGLNMRAVSENPAAADASGVNITLYKYVHILIGGALCGLGGAYISTSFVPRWQQDITSGQGWIAVALVIFATWSPLRAIFGAYLFGILRGLGITLQNVPIFGVEISSQFLDVLPYIITIVVLIFTTIRQKKESQAPLALGLPYFREDR